MFLCSLTTHIQVHPHTILLLLLLLSLTVTTTPFTTASFTTNSTTTTSTTTTPTPTTTTTTTTVTATTAATTTTALMISPISVKLHLQTHCEHSSCWISWKQGSFEEAQSQTATCCFTSPIEWYLYNEFIVPQ